MNCITSTNNVDSYDVLKLVGILMVAMILVIILSLGTHMNGCICECDADICRAITTNMRDSNYLAGSKTQPIGCIFTIWELSHVCLHILIGYYFNIYLSLGIGIAFEIFEHKFFDCGSMMDVFWNALGALIGISMRC